MPHTGTLDCYYSDAHRSYALLAHFLFITVGKSGFYPKGYIPEGAIAKTKEERDQEPKRNIDEVFDEMVSAHCLVLVLVLSFKNRISLTDFPASVNVNTLAF